MGGFVRARVRAPQMLPTGNCLAGHCTWRDIASHLATACAFACVFRMCMSILRVHFAFAILKHAAIAIIALTSSPKSEYGMMLLFIPFI